MALAVLLVGVPGHAQGRDESLPEPHRQVRALLDRGHAAQALARADAWLEQNPTDPQMRFLRAAALDGAGRTQEARAVLERLTLDYPELPEPHNNLAVIHAARGRLEEARQALELALRNHPQYATAWENLAHVHARLAHRAWSRARALGVDGVRPGLAPPGDVLHVSPAPPGAQTP